jgi:integrase
MAPRIIGRLPASYKKLKPGLHCDGGNLHLQITEGVVGNRRLSWIFRYALSGQKTRDMGLGSLNDVSLVEAREIARTYRKMIKDGIDPIDRRNEKVAKNLAETLAKRAAVMTFDCAAEAYIRKHKPGWKSAVHAAQWETTLATYASPIIGKMSVADIETKHVLKVLEEIWHDKPETASRVRGRIESVLGWATVSGHRSGENPARWKDHLDNLLPARSKVQKVKHQASLPYAEMPGFMSELRQRSGIAALALEFAILTCVRTADVRAARKADVDRAGKMWIIPSFSKTNVEHKVPLSPQALAVFDKVCAMTGEIGGRVGASDMLFPNDVSGAMLSENAMLAVLERMGRKGQMTTHGCRSSFRTWAQECTNFPWELAEMSLGHTVGNKVERAYARGDAFKKRIAIMQAWANFCDRPVDSGKVLPLRRSVESAGVSNAG